LKRDTGLLRRLPYAALLAMVLGIEQPAPIVAHAATGIDTTASALQLAQALSADASTVTGASFVAVPPSGTPNAVVSTPLAGFPTNGSTYALLTTGDANLASQPNTSGSSGADDNGPNVRGNTDFDVTILKVDLSVPAGVNCMLGLDFRFLSEEYPEYVGTAYNDAFIAELDKSTWTTQGSTITAPDNFAFDPAGNPISINAAGVTSMTAAESAGTTYDGATPLLSAATPITPGVHSLYLSIFDQGDHIYDSAVMLDNLRFGTVANVATDCKPGAKPVANIPLIYIPGIAGSELSALRDSPTGGRTFVDSHGSNKTESYTTGEAIWLNGSKLEPLPQAFNDQEFLDLLRFDSTGNPQFGDFAPSGQFVTATVRPPGVAAQTVAPYGNVVPALTSAGYSLGNNLFIFAYDWRYNADHARGDLDAMVSQVLTETGATSVDIIAHSMGTMVTRDYLLYGANRSKVHSVVLLAPPNLGTVKGTVAVHQGVCLPDSLTGIQAVGNCYISDRTVRYIYRTIPGGLDQTPSQGYYAVYNGKDAAHPVAFRDDTVNPSAVDWSALAKYETAPGPSDTNCTLVFCQDEAAVTTAAFNAANAFHNQEDDWYNHVSTPVAIMVGTGKCTIGEILKEPVVTFSRAGRTVTTRWDIRNIDGDGTVTRRSASLDDGRLAPSVSLYYRNFDHSGMGSETSVLSDAVSILHGSTPSRGTIGAPNAKTCTQIIVESPMELQITDSQGKRLGSLDGQTDYREQATNEFMRLDETKNATIYSGDTFRADLRGTANGEASIKMRVVGVDQTLKVLAFNHVPVTPKTKAFFTFDTTNSTISALTVDPDGTGQNTQTIAPVEISSNADDDVPPTINVLSPRPGQAVVGNFAVNWTATKAAGSPVTLTYGVIDAGGALPQSVDRPGTFTVAAGTHTLDIYAEDALGNSATAHVDFTADSFGWNLPMSAGGITVRGNNTTVPVKFSVTTPGGGFVNDASCVVAVVDASGTVVLSQPCAVDLNAPFYQANVDTGSLAAGSYSVRVSFDSPTLTGSFAAPLVKS
jgi:pimeloyl-ACP methyl ester carboxylesterase